MSGLPFDLPPISAEAQPDFTDAQSCTAWLQGIPLINVGPSHGRLLGELEELNAFDMAAVERLKILELLREPVLFLQAEHAKKVTNRAVPLARPEREILINIDALWTAMTQGYLRCLQAFAGMERGLLAGSGQLPLACQRALWCTGRRMAEHYKCYRRPAPEDWALLHSLYALAEDRKVCDVSLESAVAAEEPGGAAKTSCAQTYVQALLLDIANPNELSSRQLALIARWLERIGAKARVALPAAATPVATDTPAVPATAAPRPIRFDLASRAGASRGEPSGASPGLRVLDVSELDRLLRERLAALKAGEAPASLGLGDDVPAQLAESLLGLLLRVWCEDHAPRAASRRSAAGKALVTSGMGAIHYYLSGLPFKQPGNAKELSKEQRDEIATFGRIATRQDDEYAKTNDFTVEMWAILDESMAGFRLRRETGTGRYLHTKLVALRPADAPNFSLGAVRWLSVDDAYVLDMGVRAIPGVPQAIAIRPMGLNAMAEKYVPALLLPALAALRSPASLILPVGWYKPRRLIEVFSDRARPMLLTSVLERGSDYERVGFEPGE